jgi:hypothetical protein
MRRWPLVLIAAPAAVAVWSGWVGLGGMCGFGVVHPLPGIVPGLELNTAITLPVGVEAYGAYAIGTWLGPAGVPPPARKFARNSAIGALALGMTGQIIYHLLVAAHATRAPWPVVVLVSCLPVAVLGLAAALTHLLRAAEGAGSQDPETPAAGPSTAGPGVPGTVPAAAAANGQPHPDATRVFAADIAAGKVPGIRRIRAELHCGQGRAQEVQAYLTALTGGR